MRVLNASLRVVIGLMMLIIEIRAEPRTRDLARYDKGGTLVTDNTKSERTLSATKAKLRNFLWDHWSQRRLGVIVVSGVTMEGQPNTTSYFIEPGNNGTWRIALEIEREDFDLMKRTSEHRSERFSACHVTRVEVPKDGGATRIVIPDPEPRESKSYRLVLKDCLGEVLEEL
jgi:hypothetical protein